MLQLHKTADAATAPILVSYLRGCRSWTVNTYAKCEFRCIYCVTRTQGSSIPIVTSEQVAELVGDQIKAVPSDRLIHVGAIADGYPPVEAEHGVTRAALLALMALDRPFNVITKGLTVRRDFDLIKQSKKNGLIVSLSSHEDDKLRRLDPRAPSLRERLDLIEDACCDGIPVNLNIAPWIPHVTRVEEIMQLVPKSVTAYLLPLNVVSTGIDYPILGRRYDQAELNDLYRAEQERLSHRNDLVWFPPIEQEFWDLT